MDKEARVQEICAKVVGSIKRGIKRANGRKIFLWGASLAGEASKRVLDDMGVDFEGFIDSNESKKGQMLCGMKIFSPDKIANKSNEYFIVIASSFYKSIKNQLYSLGYTEADMCGTIDAAHKPVDVCTSLQLEITNRCNLKCHFCLAGSNKDERIYKDMSKENAIKIIDDIVEDGIEMFVYSGNAENTLHKDYVEILEYAASRFKHIEILTNGHTLTKEMKDVILSKENKSKFTVKFSATGFSAQVYNDFQGSGRKDKSDKLRNNLYKIIGDLVNERNAKNKDVMIGLRYILTDDNLDDFKEYVRFWGDKVDAIECYPLFNEDGPANSEKIKKSTLKICMNINRALIRLDGTTHICCGSGHILGNAIDTHISEIRNSDEYAKVLDSMARLDFDALPTSCKKCFYMFFNEFAVGVEYLQARKFDNCYDKLSRLANEKPILLFPRDQGADELFYSMYVNRKLEYFDISISDPYEKGYYEHFEIQQPSVEVFKDKLVICFNDYELNILDPKIKEAAYKIVSVSDILEGRE